MKWVLAVLGVLCDKEMDVGMYIWVGRRHSEE